MKKKTRNTNFAPEGKSNILEIQNYLSTLDQMVTFCFVCGISKVQLPAQTNTAVRNLELTSMTALNNHFPTGCKVVLLQTANLLGKY